MTLDHRNVNVAGISLHVVEGDREYGDLERYVAGLRTTGLRNVTGRLIRACGPRQMSNRSRSPR
jgi:hypothetical protein